MEWVDDKEETHLFANAMSIGIDSVIADYASHFVRRLPYLHKMAYLLGIIPALMRSLKLKLSLSFKGLRWENPAASQLPDPNLVRASEHEGTYEYTLSALCNARFYGGGFQPDRHANLSDGVVEYCITEPVRRRTIAKLLPKYKKGLAQESGVIRMFSASEGEIRSAKPGEKLSITSDGEVFYSEFVRFKVRHKALWLARPESLLG